MDKIAQINAVLKTYFAKNPTSDRILAKEFMPQFIKAGIFVKDSQGGLPIRRKLRALDKAKQLHRIPFVIADRKLKNTNWYFAKSNYTAPVEETVATIKTKKCYKVQIQFTKNQRRTLCD